MKTLAIIPARGGSKGIPRKNIIPIKGKPLIAYTIEQAKNSKHLDRCVVSTEDIEIKNIAQEYGAEVIDRPTTLASDTAKSIDVVLHTLQTLKEKENYIPDAVMILQVTSPLRKSTDIDQAINLFSESECDSLVSVCVAPEKANPHWIRKIENGYLKNYIDGDTQSDRPRQQLPKVYWRNGMIYLTKTSVILEKNNIYGDKSYPMIMDPRYYVNLDEPSDLILLEALIDKNLVSL